MVILLLAAHRLPAPVSEIPQGTPAPKPKREALPRSKPKVETPLKTKATPNRSFAGTWNGNVVTSASDGSANSSATYLIRISDDERTAWVNWSQTGQPMTGAGAQAPCNRFRETLTWTLTLSESTATDTMRIDVNGNASFVREGTWTSGDNQGTTYNHTGTLSRQDSSAAPSIPQTTTASPQATGVPTARAVPNKPGFVYDPFDQNSKTLIDVRGRPSGTKVKDQSGRLFVVP